MQFTAWILAILTWWINFCIICEKWKEFTWGQLVHVSPLSHISSPQMSKRICVKNNKSKRVSLLHVLSLQSIGQITQFSPIDLELFPSPHSAILQISKETRIVRELSTNVTNIRVHVVVPLNPKGIGCNSKSPQCWCNSYAYHILHCLLHIHPHLNFIIIYTYSKNVCCQTYAVWINIFHSGATWTAHKRALCVVAVAFANIGSIAFIHVNTFQSFVSFVANTIIWSKRVITGSILATISCVCSAFVDICNWWADFY